MQQWPAPSSTPPSRLAQATEPTGFFTSVAHVHLSPELLGQLIESERYARPIAGHLLRSMSRGTTRLTSSTGMAKPMPAYAPDGL